MREHAGRLDVPADELEWCHEAVQGVSRTFALTIETLDEPMSSYICVGYLICRIADTVEDESAIPPEERTELLELFDRALDPEDDADVAAFREAVDPHLPEAEDRADEWDVVANASRVIRVFEELPPDVREAIVPPTRELVGGMSTLVERHAESDGIRIQTEGELEEYCYYVAGTVGTLVTNLLARGGVSEHRRERLYANAEEFGLLLQLVNIAKDVHEDYTDENNVYVPAEWLEDEGVPQDGVVRPEHATGATAAIQRVVGRAREYLDDAEAYLLALPAAESTRAAWTIPFLLAVGTLRELSERPDDALSEGGVKISRSEVVAIVSTVSGSLPPERLTALREAIRNEPLDGQSQSSACR